MQNNDWLFKEITTDEFNLYFINHNKINISKDEYSQIPFPVTSSHLLHLSDTILTLVNYKFSLDFKIYFDIQKYEDDWYTINIDSVHTGKYITPLNNKKYLCDELEGFIQCISFIYESTLSKKYTHLQRWKYKAISAYKFVDDPNEWENCPNCNLKPIVWEYNNGRSTACGCGENEYRHFSIHTESVMSVVSHSDTGRSAVDYKVNDLKDNWNNWVNTGEIRFPNGKGDRTDGRW